MKNCIIVKQSYCYNDEGFDLETGVEIIPTLYTKEEAKKEIENKYKSLDKFEQYFPYSIDKGDYEYEELIKLGCIIKTYSKYSCVTLEDITFPKDKVLEILKVFNMDDFYQIIELN